MSEGPRRPGPPAGRARGARVSRSESVVHGFSMAVNQFCVWAERPGAGGSRPGWAVRLLAPLLERPAEARAGARNVYMIQPLVELYGYCMVVLKVS